MVTVRFAPRIHQHVMSQPGGARTYLERLINEDIQRTQVAESISPEDTPVKLFPEGKPEKAKSNRLILSAESSATSPPDNTCLTRETINRKIAVSNKCQPLFDKDTPQIYHLPVEKMCSESGCDRDAHVTGLCSLHYQRHRRQEKGGQAKVGRPREYTEDAADPGGGAPRITVRLEPDLLEWVRQRGGGGWLRHISRELRDLAQNPQFRDWCEVLDLPVNSKLSGL